VRRLLSEYCVVPPRYENQLDKLMEQSFNLDQIDMTHGELKDTAITVRMLRLSNVAQACDIPDVYYSRRV
jgi:hypothetical protein